MAQFHKGGGNDAHGVINRHPMKNRIIERIIDGDALKTICADTDPKISYASLQRYKQQVILPQLVKAFRTRTRPPAKPDAHYTKEQAAQRIADLKTINKVVSAPPTSVFRARLEEIHTRVERVLDRAEASKDMASIAPLINQAHKNVELLGKATGELEPSSGSGIQIQIICPSAPDPASMPRISFASPDAIEGGTITPLRAGDAYNDDSAEDIGIRQRPH